MKESLIKLAKKHGFVGYFPKEWEYNTNEPLRYYFWMCELQKWLRDEYRILVEAVAVNDWDHWIYSITVEGAMCPFDELSWNEKEYSSYEEALEAGLQEVLKLINK